MRDLVVAARRGPSPRQEAASPHDELLVSFTERDSGHLVRRFGEESTTLGWWWDRIPRTGLVRGDLEHWLATTIGEMTSRE